MSFGPEDLDRVEAAKNGAKPRKGGKIPFLPERSATLPTIRGWLSRSIGLPPEVTVDAVVRPGRDDGDPLTLILSNGLRMRCPAQKRLQQARSLQAFIVSESDGIAMAPYLSPAEVGDVYTAMCRLGSAAARNDPIAELRERLFMFMRITDEIVGSIADALRRYSTLRAILARTAFDRSAALAMRGAKPEIAPVCLLDDRDSERYVRASEWIAYQRFVLGQTVDDGLAARMAELGSERVHPQAWNSDRSHKNNVVLYRVPVDDPSEENAE